MALVRQRCWQGRGTKQGLCEAGMSCLQPISHRQNRPSEWFVSAELSWIQTGTSQKPQGTTPPACVVPILPAGMKTQAERRQYFMWQRWQRNTRSASGLNKSSLSSNYLASVTRPGTATCKALGLQQQRPKHSTSLELRDFPLPWHSQEQGWDGCMSRGLQCMPRSSPSSKDGSTWALLQVLQTPVVYLISFLRHAGYYHASRKAFSRSQGRTSKWDLVSLHSLNRPERSAKRRKNSSGRLKCHS